MARVEIHGNIVDFPDELQGEDLNKAVASAAAQLHPSESMTDSPGPIESAGRGFVNNVPLAPQVAAEGGAMVDAFKGKSLPDKIKALVQGHIDTPPDAYSKNLADWNTKAAAAKAANPKSYGAGAVAGAVAPLAIPGVGEALEAAPILGNAALGAAGAISNTDLIKNPAQIAKQAAVGAGIGGATGGIVKAFAPEASTLNSMANRTAVKSLNLPGDYLGKMAPEERQAVGEFARANGLVGKDKEAMLEKARSMTQSFGEKIGQISDQAGEEGLHVDPADHNKAVQSLLDKAERWKSNLPLDESGKMVGTPLPDAMKMRKGYQGAADAILNLPANPTWRDVQALKERFGELAFDPNSGVKSAPMKDGYFATKDMLKGIADKAQANPNMPQEYKAALAGYSKTQPIESGLEKAVGSEASGANGRSARGPIGIIRQLPGPIRAAIGAGAALTGHPYIATAAAIPEILNPAIQSKVLGGAAKLSGAVGPEVTNGSTQAIRDFLTSRLGVKFSQNGQAIPPTIKTLVGTRKK